MSVLILPFVAALCVGLAKGGLGGFAALAVLVMAEAMPARASTGVILLLLIMGDSYAVRAYGAHANWKMVRRLMLPVALGIIAGWWIMDRIDDVTFRVTLGWIILVLSVIQVARPYFEEPFEAVARTPMCANLFGWMAGMATMLANAAGAVMTLYFLSVSPAKMAFLGTQSWLFIMLNLFKVPFSIDLGLINLDVVLSSVVLAPGVIMGLIIARAVIDWISQRWFERLMLAFTVAAALRLIL
jgi:hypothetical protein